MSDTITLFCLVQGSPTENAFSVKINENETIGILKKLIKAEMQPKLDTINANKLTLWRVEIAVGDGSIIPKLGPNGKKMLPTSNIAEYFPGPLADESIHVIVERPPALVKWYNTQSIRQWVRQYERPPGTEPSQLVETFGSIFPLLRREDTINTLWNGVASNNGVLRRFHVRGTGDRNNHPIAFLACGPGTGKSRFLQEVGRMLRDKANSCNNDDVKNSFSKVLAINVTFGNGSPASDTDVELGEASVGIRLLYQYFVSTRSTRMGMDKVTIDFQTFTNEAVAVGVASLRLATATDVVWSDYFGDESTGALVLGIDEVNQLHEHSSKALHSILTAVGGLSCANPRFFVPILAGTIQGPLEDMVRESTYLFLHLPLPLLTEEDVINIGSNLSVKSKEGDRTLHLTEDFVRHNSLFRRCITDVGGMARGVEYFFNSFFLAVDRVKDTWPEDDAELTKALEYIDVMEVMKTVEGSLNDRYPFDAHVIYAMPVLTNAILDIPIYIDDTIRVGNNSITYKSLRSAGILNLEPQENTNKFYVRVPYMWMVLLVKAAASKSFRSPWRFWTTFLDPAGTISWGQWEIFNTKFWALRLSLLSAAGITTANLEELFPGAEFTSSCPDFKVTIPDFSEMEIHELFNKYPESQEVLDYNSQNHSDLHTKFNKVFVNGKNALIDGFSFLQQPKTANDLMICFQMKLAEYGSMNLFDITANDLEDESDNFRSAQELLRDQNLDYVFVVLSNRHKTKAAKFPCDINGILVHRENFKSYYGYTFAGRAEFSASSRLYINSAPTFHISHIPDIKSTIVATIDTERKKRKFCDDEDLMRRVPKFPRKELSSIMY